MATKMPFLQFYPADWAADTRILSLSARGAWLELICAMYVRGRTDTVSGTPERLAGLIGCTKDEFLSALEELKSNDIADIEECNGVVTVTCRRFREEKNEREKTNSRVKKFRETQMKRDCNGESNESVTGDISYIRVQNKEITLASDKEKALQEDFLPHSIDDVIELAKHPYCGMPCSWEQASAYFTDRVQRDWIPHGQNSRLNTIYRVAADLKKWLMRDQNKTNGRQNGNNNGKRDVRVISNDPAKFDPADDGSNI